MRHLPRVAPSEIQCTNPNASQAAARHANHGHHNCRVSNPRTALPASQNNETPTTCSAVQHAPNKSSADRHVRWLETSTKCSNIYTVHQLCLTGRSQADNSRHSKVNSRQSGSASRTGAGHHVRHPVYISGLRPRGRQRRQEPSPTRQKGYTSHSGRSKAQRDTPDHHGSHFPGSGTNDGHYKQLSTQRPGSPKNTTQHHDVSVQSTLDRRPMYYSQKMDPSSPNANSIMWTHTSLEINIKFKIK